MKKAKSRGSFILAFFLIMLMCISVSFCVWLNVGMHEKQLQLDMLNSRLNELQQNNAELDRLINNADEAELYEHLARARGYVYPDEKVYFNVTPGK